TCVATPVPLRLVTCLIRDLQLVERVASRCEQTWSGKLLEGQIVGAATHVAECRTLLVRRFVNRGDLVRPSLAALAEGDLTLEQPFADSLLASGRRRQHLLVLLAHPKFATEEPAEFAVVLLRSDRGAVRPQLENIDIVEIKQGQVTVLGIGEAIVADAQIRVTGVVRPRFEGDRHAVAFTFDVVVTVVELLDEVVLVAVGSVLEAERTTGFVIV